MGIVEQLGNDPSPIVLRPGFVSHPGGSLRHQLKPFAACLLIALTTLFSYWGQLSYPLTDVDVQPLILTGRFDSMTSLWSVLSEPLMQGRMVNALYWRPVTSLSYGFDALLWDLNPIGYHLTDLLLHLATGLLLFAFVRQLWRDLDRTDGERIALTAAILFVLHPVHVENVPAVARRGDVLVGLFLLLTLFFLLQSLRAPRLWSSLAAQASCVLGLGSKESGFAIPIIGVLFYLCFYRKRERGGLSHAVIQGASLLVLGVLAFALRGFILHDIGGAETSTQGPIWWRSPYSLWLHVYGLFLPGSAQAVAFPSPRQLPTIARNVVQAHPLVLGLMSLALLTALVVLVRKLDWSRSSSRILIFCVGAMGSLMLVYSQVVFQTRYLYPSALFFCTLLAWGLWQAGRAVLTPDSLVKRLVSVSGLVAIGILTATLLAGSPLFNHADLDEWKISAQISQQALDDIEGYVPALARGSRIYLVDFPYRIDRPVLPWSVMLLEHSVQGWLDLRFPEKELDVVGLSYLVFEYPIVDLDLEAEMHPDGTLTVHVSGKGSATSFPWSTQYGDQREGTLLEYVGGKRGKNLTIRLLDIDSESGPAFFVWLIDRVELARGWNWRLSARASDRPDHS